jgi:hypothetical protein
MVRNVFAKVVMDYLTIFVQSVQVMRKVIQLGLPAPAIYPILYLILLHLNANLVMLIHIIQKTTLNVYVIMVSNKAEIVAYQFVILMRKSVLKQMDAIVNMGL